MLLLSTGKETFKNCTRCGYLFPLRKFGMLATGTAGRNPKCKKCARAYSREWEAERKGA